MDKITLAHIGGEIVLIGGVAFYFHRKTVKMNEQITALQKENAELKEAIQDLNSSVQELGMLVMQMRNALGSRASAASVSATTPPIIMSMGLPPFQQQGNKVTEKAIKKPSIKLEPQSSTTTKATVRKVNTGGDDSGDETSLDEADLDKEIEQELSQLSKERKDNPTIAKVNCDDGVCKLVDDE